jgi:predicted fused transcriptional regulator/phosphomethylpyrimidine kinase
MQIEVSIGEVVDKWTILSIKALNIKDKDKLVNVFKEKNYLNTVIDPEILHDPMTDELLKVNQFLWKVEDLLRDFERASSFGDEFIDLARSVYRLNDQRAHIKKDINIKYGSDFVEEKSYQPY